MGGHDHLRNTRSASIPQLILHNTILRQLIKVHWRPVGYRSRIMITLSLCSNIRRQLKYLLLWTRYQMHILEILSWATAKLDPTHLIAPFSPYYRLPCSLLQLSVVGLCFSSDYRHNLNISTCWTLYWHIQTSRVELSVFWFPQILWSVGILPISSALWNQGSPMVSL